MDTQSEFTFQIYILFIVDIAIWASPDKYTYFIIFVNVTNVDA